MDKHLLKKYMELDPEAKLRDLVMKLIYDEIVSLRIRPGSKLNVNQIASSLGISRTPVAEAVAILTEKGFVISKPGQSGSFVVELNLPDMINLYRVRNAIESEAAALCAHVASDSALRELSHLADAFKESVINHDTRGMRETDMPFHRLLVESCANPYLIQSYRQILPILTMYQASMLEFVGQQGNEFNPWYESVKYNHVSVVSAIRMRMPDMARKAMSDHVDSSLNFTSYCGIINDPFLNVKY